MSERLTPIPTPPAQLWRQLRLQYFPVVVFVAGVAAAAFIWMHWVAPPTLVGEAEAVRTELRSAQAGTLVDVNVDLLQPVKAGQIIGRVIVNDPKILEATLAVTRAEIEVLRTSTSLTIEQLRIDWLNKRVQLVALQGQLQQAEATLARTQTLHRNNLVTEEEYEHAKNARDAITAQIKVQSELIARLEPEARPNPASDRAIPTASRGLRAAIKQKEEELRLIEAQLSPVPLVAPIDGVVTLLLRRSGEIVGSSEPILQISATQSKRIIGFLRQPFPSDTKPGMSVEVRTRTFLRRTGTATVTEVGHQLEPISPTLLAAMRLPVSTIPTEFGLRVHVSSPSGLTLRPGEQVDIIFRE
jgi:multidrug resistance efflux pump